MAPHNDVPAPGPSEEDIAEAHRLRVLHRPSAATDGGVCLWCREAWPCRHRQWSDEVMRAAEEREAGE